MTRILKVWLWILLVLHVSSCVVMAVVAIVSPSSWIDVGLEMLSVAGIGLLLFARKKLGFYLFCASAVIGFIVSVILGTSVIFALISAVLASLIVWLLMKNTWYEFQ